MRDFDDIIRGKLGDSRSEESPDWDRMRERLDGDAFDARLRGALPGGTFTTAAFTTTAAGDSAPVSDWDALEAKLDTAAELEADAFDQLIARRLAHAESGVAPTESWRQLSHRMDTLWPLRRVLVRYRAPELAAAALLLFTFLPLLRDNAIWEQLTGRAPATVAHRAPVPTLDSYARATDANGPAAVAAVATPGVLAPDEIASLIARHDALLGSSAAPQAARRQALERIAPGLGALADIYYELTATPDPERVALAPVSSQSTGAAARGATASISDLRAAAERDRASYTDLERLDARRQTSLARAIPTLVASPVSRAPARWQVGVSGGLAVLRVRTPADAHFDAVERHRRLAVPQIGAHVLYDARPRLRLGLTAAVFTASYDPELPTVTRAYEPNRDDTGYSEDFRNITLEQVSAAVDVRYGLVPRPRRAQVWAKAGLGAGVTAVANYDVHRAPTSARATNIPVASTEVHGGFPSAGTNGGDPGAGKGRPSIYSSATPTSVKEFSDGLLQGGGIAESTQAFGRVGLEGEVRLGRRVRVFGTADYDFALPRQRGFGPNQDRFSGLSTEIGARVSL